MNHPVSIVSRTIESTAAGLLAAALAGCGGGGSSSGGASPQTSAPSTSVRLTSQFAESPIQGLCYSTWPSKLVGETDVNGKYQYVAGDVVTFWIDGTGASACTAASQNGSTSVVLGSSATSSLQNAVTSVLSLDNAGQAIEVLAALNIGSAQAMAVGGVRLPEQTAADLNAYISSGGATMPVSASGSRDAFFASVQASASQSAIGTLPTFALAASASASQANGFAMAAAQQLHDVAVDLQMEPKTHAFAADQLQFTVFHRYSPLSVGDGDMAAAEAQFEYYDGAGKATVLGSPRGGAVTLANLSDLTQSGTYTTSPLSFFGRILSGVDVTSGRAFTETGGVAINYESGDNYIETGAYSRTYATDPDSGASFDSGSYTAASTTLKALSISDLANHSVQYFGPCSGSPPATLTLGFAAVVAASGVKPATVTGTSSCGKSAMTFQDGPVKGIVLATDATGMIAYVGVSGSSFGDGARLHFLYEAAGTAGNASPSKGWSTVGPLFGFN